MRLQIPGQPLPVKNILTCPALTASHLPLWLTSFHLPGSRCPFQTTLGLGHIQYGGVQHRYRYALSKASRPLDHAFLISGLHRFGEALSGSAFSLLIFRNILETAHPRWILEMSFLHSRLAQLFSLSRARHPMSIDLPRHPWYGGARVLISAICHRDPFLLTQ